MYKYKRHLNIGYSNRFITINHNIFKYLFKIMKRLSGLFLVALLSCITTLGAYKLFFDNGTKSMLSVAPLSSNPLRAVNYTSGAETVHFTAAADKAVHTVVHVKNVSYVTVPSSPFDYFFGSRG